MAEPTPTWRRLFDTAERAVGPRLEEVVRSEQFAVAVGLLQRVRKDMNERGERASRQMLHAFNLPAGSDINRLLSQIGALEREVRQLRKQLTDAQTTTRKEASRGSAPRAKRAPRTRAS